jgi:tetratricopeptide (TPR) repeat protein
MDGRVVLLGRPRIDAGDRPVQLAGRKPWGLLAYLCLEPPATRQELAALLFSAADDPLAALRWSLLQVRRALTGLAEVPEVHGRLSIASAAGVEVDVARVLSGDVTVDQAKRLPSGELLAGLAFDDEPGFDSWLLLQRSRVSAAVEEGAGLGRVHPGPHRARRRAGAHRPRDPRRPVQRLAARARGRDPPGPGGPPGRRGVGPARERPVRQGAGRAGAGDNSAPAGPPRPAADPPPIRLDTAARALLEGAQARFDAGDYQGGLEMARRAASSAAGSGDVVLQARSLVTLGGILVHSLRGRDREALGLLRRAQQLATTVHHPELVADAERELGYVAFLEARYGAAEEALQRSIASAQQVGDTARAARAGAELARAGGAAALVPWAIVWGAEAALELGDEAAAETAYAEAYTLGCEISDPCWEALALRGLALVARRNQRTDQAKDLLAEAVTCCRRLSDVYKWAEALVLTDLLELDPDDDAELARALRLATTGPMPDLFQRLQHRSVLQTRVQTDDG